MTSRAAPRHAIGSIKSGPAMSRSAQKSRVLAANNHVVAVVKRRTTAPLKVALTMSNAAPSLASGWFSNVPNSVPSKGILFLRNIEFTSALADASDRQLS